MKFFVVIIIFAMITLAVGKPPAPPKLPDNDTCGRSQLCLQCCRKNNACLTQCFFFHSDRDWCRKECGEQSCTKGWHECSEECDLPWCKGEDWSAQSVGAEYDGTPAPVQKTCDSDGEQGCIDQTTGHGEDFNNTKTYNESTETGQQSATGSVR